VDKSALCGSWSAWVDEFMVTERLGLAGLGLPAMSRQGLVFPKLLGR
jgi:hypothetical protein